MLWGIKIWKIVFWAIAFPIIASLGIAIRQDAQENNFSSGARLVESYQISAARNLTGTWQGSITVEHAHPGEPSYCTYSGTLTLVLAQTENTLRGTWQVNVEKVDSKQTASRSLNCVKAGPSSVINISDGIVSSSAFTFKLNTITVDASFTNDLINGNYRYTDRDTVGTSNFRLVRK